MACSPCSGSRSLLAVVLTLVDSYRRRGKRPKPFPTTPPAEVTIGDGTVTTYTFGQDLYDDMLAAIEQRRAPDPLRVLHLEGRRDRRGVQAGAEPGGRPRRRGLRGLRRVRQPGGLAAVQAVRPAAQGAGVPRLQRRLAVLRPAPLRPRPPQDPGRRRPGRLRRRLQHRLGLRHRVARHARPDHRARACGTWPGPSRTSGTSTASPATASGRCCWRPSPTGSRGSGCTATCPGCGCSRSGRCTSRRSTGPPTTSG